MKNETIKVTSAVGANNPPKPQPQPTNRLAAAIAVKRAAQAKDPVSARVARERLEAAKAEAFPRSDQYRPAGVRTGHVGSGEG